jgi:hypothetical protein
VVIGGRGVSPALTPTAEELVAGGSGVHLAGTVPLVRADWEQALWGKVEQLASTSLNPEEARSGR